MINNSELIFKKLVDSVSQKTFYEINQSKRLDSISTLCKELYEQTEEVIKSESDKIEPLLDCKYGCSFCCYNQVTATPIEIITIAAYLKENLNKEELDNLKNKIESTDKITHGLNHLERKKAKIPCPLLKDNICSVYEVRPLACRGWNSTNVKDCESAYNSSEEGQIHVFGPQLMASNSVSIGINQGLQNGGYKPENLELTSALKIALSKYNVDEKYFSGKHIFRDARLNY